MSADEAAEYHGWQVAVLAGAGAERITALTLTYPEEAVGVIRAALAAGVPAVVSFTVETDGRLPDGTPIASAIAAVDPATGGAAEFFMLNCAHPTRIARGLSGEPSLARVGGLRLNASALSHAELDAAAELDEGDPRPRRAAPRLAGDPPPRRLLRNRPPPRHGDRPRVGARRTRERRSVQSGCSLRIAIGAEP